MLTGNWNSLAHNEILSLHAARLGRALRILTSVASEDGVYDLHDLRGALTAFAADQVEA